MSRASFKMKLQKDQAEAQQKKTVNLHGQNFAPHTPAIFLPNASGVQSASVPGTVLQVQTNLQHPTRYHVQQKQRNQVASYLSNSVGTNKTALNQLLHPHSSLPDKMSHGVSGTGMSAPASPLAQLNLSSSDQVDDIIDDIVSLQSSFGEDQSHLSTTLPTVDRTDLSNFTVSAASKLAVFDQNKTSSSCPPEIVPKQEFYDDGVNYMQDRAKKDNHNRIERRRRYNINDRIKELGTLVPRSNDPDMRWNKGSILKASVDHMRDLQAKVSQAQQIEMRHREMQNVNKHLLLRIQQLEMMAKTKGIEVPPMQEKQEILDTLLTSDAHNLGGQNRNFSREEEYEVANFPSQTLSPDMSGLGNFHGEFKQETISPSRIPMQAPQDNMPQYMPAHNASPGNFNNQPPNAFLMQQQQQQQQPQQHIVSIEVTNPQQQSFSPHLTPNESHVYAQQGHVDNAQNDPLMAFGDSTQTFSSLLNQADITFDDVLMEEDTTPIKTDIFLSDSVELQ